MKRLQPIFISVLLLAYLTGCASKALLRDEAGHPISEAEVKAKKKNNNLILFAVGGTALSFGASFFIGSLLDRGNDDESRTALWITTGVGTVAGLVYFVHTGSTRDFNYAVEAVKEERKQEVAQKLAREEQKQSKLKREKQRLLEERKRQEAERKKLMEELKKKQKKNKKKTGDTH